MAPLALVGVLVAELLYLTVRFDTQALDHSSSAWLRFVASAPQYLQVAVTVAVVGLLLGGRQLVVPAIRASGYRGYRLAASAVHSDLEYDFSTGARFHPLEAIVTTLFVMTTIAAIGAPPAGVMLSQILLAMVAFSEHANVLIPERMDKAIRLVFVTPNMHRVHHSVELDEGNSNFSNMFSFWDRLFGTYIDRPAAGHQRMEFGLKEVRDRGRLTLPRLLAQPFVDLPSATTHHVAPVERPAVERT